LCLWSQFYDNPFDLSQNLGIQCDEAFIPCVTRGMIVHFEMHVLTGWLGVETLAHYTYHRWWMGLNQWIYVSRAEELLV
jgi:hypothetical protein